MKCKRINNNSRKNRIALVRKLLRLICSIINHLLGYRNIVVFRGQTGFDGNARAVYDYLKENGYGSRWLFVWMIGNSDDYTYIESKDTRIIGRRTNIFEKLYYYSCAKYFLWDDISGGLGQFSVIKNRIYLTHGCPSIKNSKGKIDLTKDGATGCLLTSDIIRPMMSEMLNFDVNRFITCGLPRNDVIFNRPRRFREFIEMGNQKIVLWMPTFRKTKNIYGIERIDSPAEYFCGLPLIHSIDDLKTIDKLLNKANIILVIKTHPVCKDVDQNTNDSQFTNIKIWTHEFFSGLGINIEALYGDSSAMITDYSSASFDYMLTDKPLGYVIDDIKEYSLGFPYSNPLEYMPGAHINTFDDLCTFFEDISCGKDEFADERRRINAWAHNEEYNDGKNSKRFVRMIGIDTN